MNIHIDLNNKKLELRDDEGRTIENYFSFNNRKVETEISTYQRARIYFNEKYVGFTVGDFNICNEGKASQHYRYPVEMLGIYARLIHEISNTYDFKNDTAMYFFLSYFLLTNLEAFSYNLTKHLENKPQRKGDSIFEDDGVNQQIKAALKKFKQVLDKNSNRLILQEYSQWGILISLIDSPILLKSFLDPQNEDLFIKIFTSKAPMGICGILANNPQFLTTFLDPAYRSIADTILESYEPMSICRILTAASPTLLKVFMNPECASFTKAILTSDDSIDICETLSKNTDLLETLLNPKHNSITDIILNSKQQRLLFRALSKSPELLEVFLSSQYEPFVKAILDAKQSGWICEILSYNNDLLEYFLTPTSGVILNSILNADHPGKLLRMITRDLDLRNRFLDSKYMDTFNALIKSNAAEAICELLSSNFDCLKIFFNPENYMHISDILSDEKNVYENIKNYLQHQK